MAATAKPARTTPRLALTCGDPAGVGPEIIARWLARQPRARVAVLGPESWLAQLPGRSAAQLIAVGDERFRAVPGKPTLAGARVALAAMEVADFVEAKYLCIFTESGDTARRMSRLRPRIPMIGFATEPAIRRRMAMAHCSCVAVSKSGIFFNYAPNMPRRLWR